jgi:hypothetical protein
MSEARAVTPSLAELVVLGCLSQSAVPSDDELGKAVRELCLLDETPERARVAALAELEQLRRRGLVDDHKKLTETGTRALREACGVSRKPAWSTFRQRFFPAIALGLTPIPAKKSGPDPLVQILAGKLDVSRASTMNGLCDVLIANELKMAPEKLTLARIRARILALRVYAASKTTSSAARHSAAERAPVAPPVTSAPPREIPPEHDGASRREEPSPVVTPNPPAPDLLAFVRETLTEIGDEGRFGDEKVFVSVLWNELAHRGTPADLSLDHFKQWLVAANRNRWLTLARADVVGAMDPKKVRESEIQDRGATFHFVLDPARNPAAQQGRRHVR